MGIFNIFKSKQGKLNKSLEDSFSPGDKHALELINVHANSASPLMMYPTPGSLAVSYIAAEAADTFKLEDEDLALVKDFFLNYPQYETWRTKFIKFTYNL